MCISIGWSIVFANPAVEHLLGFFDVYVKSRDGSLGIRPVDLLVDEGVIESDGSGIMARVCVVDGIWSSPIYGSKTHWTRLAARVQDAPVELVCLKVGASVANSLDLRMCGRVVGGDHSVVSTTNDFPIFDNNAAERSTVGFLQADG